MHPLINDGWFPQAPQPLCRPSAVRSPVAPGGAFLWALLPTPPPTATTTRKNRHTSKYYTTLPL